MSKKECPYGDESLAAADYLAGRLSREEARAFEAHSFACDRCFDELRLAAALRAGSSMAAAAPAPRASRAAWSSLGLAAVVLLAIGAWFMLPIADEPAATREPVYRDGDAPADPAQNLVLDVGRDRDRVSLAWRAVDGADRYTVRVFTAAGDPVIEEETSGTAIEIPAAAWPGSAASEQVYVQVTALDELRQTIVQSDLVPL